MTVHTQHQVFQEQLLQDQLEVQSQQIDNIFSKHQIPANVAGGSVDSHSVRFNVQTPLAAGWQRLREIQHDLKHALGTSDVEVQESLPVDQLQVDVARPYEPPVALLDLMAMLPSLSTVTAVLGLAEDGRPVLINFNSGNISHVLVSGDDNAGKTTLLRTIAASLAFSNKQSATQLLILDPAPDSNTPDSPNTLQLLNYLPHMLADVTDKGAEIKELLNFLANELGYRQKNSVKTPRIVALIDNADQLLAADDNESANALRHLARRGAMAGIHLIISTQNENHPVLSKNFKPYCPLRIVGLTKIDTAVAQPPSKANNNDADELLGEGDFLAIVGRTAPQTTHFQAAYIGDYDLHSGIRRIPQQKAILLARPYQPDTGLPSQSRQRISTIQQIPGPKHDFVSL